MCRVLSSSHPAFAAQLPERAGPHSALGLQVADPDDGVYGKAQSVFRGLVMEPDYQSLKPAGCSGFPSLRRCRALV